MSSLKWRPFCLGLNVLNQCRYSGCEISANGGDTVVTIHPSIVMDGRCIWEYRQTSNISHTFEGNKLADHVDVHLVGASPVGAAPNNYIFIIERRLQDVARDI